jgi:hypothetical protein
MVDTYVKLYRSSKLCDLLTDVLEELCEEEKISPDLANKVLDGFDQACLEALSNRAEAKGTLQVRLHLSKAVKPMRSVWLEELNISVSAEF